MIATPWISDLMPLVFTAIVLFAFSYPALRRNSIPIPEVYQFEEVRPEMLTEKQSALFAQYDAKLVKLNYVPVCTYRVTNYGSNMVRRYSHPGDPAWCSLMVVETKSKVAGLNAVGQASVLLFITMFADGRMLTTRNMALKSVLDQRPEDTVQECPGISDPASLKQRHDARAAHMGAPLPAATSVERIFAEQQEEHRRFSDYQFQRGNYARTADGYRLTDRPFRRGIVHFLIPDAHRLAPSRLLLVLLFGAGIPLATYRWAEPWLFMRSFQHGLLADPATLGAIVIGGAVLSGAALGLLLESKAFIWTYLLTFLGVHLGTSWNFSSTKFSLTACVAAYFVSQIHMRTRLMLPGRPSPAKNA